jgi:magnesium chelatase family protein
MPRSSNRLTINLAPADKRKEGLTHDFPIAISILLASEQIFGDLDGAIIMGELSLDGSVRHVSGVLPIAVIAREQGYQALYVPVEDAAEASLIEGLDVYPVPDLLTLIDHLTGHACLASVQPDFSLASADDLPPYTADLAEMKCQGLVILSSFAGLIDYNHVRTSLSASSPALWMKFLV